MTPQIPTLEADVYIATKRDRVLDQKVSQFVLISRKTYDWNGDRWQINNLYGQFTSGSNTYLDAFYPLRTSRGSALYGGYPHGSNIWITPSIDAQLQKADHSQPLVLQRNSNLFTVPADLYLVHYVSKELLRDDRWKCAVACAQKEAELAQYTHSLPDIRCERLEPLAPTQRERPQDFQDGVIIVPSVIKTYQKNWRGIHL